jgi:OmpA-OmpF porin, OOP family
MKFTVFILFTSLLFGSVTAQEKLPERQKRRTKEKATQRLEDKIEGGVDKTLDKIDEKLSGIGKKKKKKKCGKKDSEEETADNSTNNSGSTSSQQESNSNSTTENANNSGSNTTSGSSSSNQTSGSTNGGSTATPTNPEFKRYSKFDFVSGEKVIAYDDFSDANLGDFPLEWNTNSSAEIVTVENTNQKWLFMSQDGFFQPEFIKEMPENFTLEFDVFTRYRSSNIVRYGMTFAASENPRVDLSEKYLSNMIEFKWNACMGDLAYFVTEADETVNKNEGLSSEALKCSGENYEEPSMVHFSVWRQKNRLRIYINEQKIIDVPQAFNPNKTFNLFRFGAEYMNFSTADQEDEFMVTNLRYAVGAPDTRSKLITEGKLVSRGILFDVNSDKLKAESYGALKEVAQALKENPTVRVKIVGHTDSDGDDAANLELSKKRAAAVKTALSTEFGIDASRMDTDGMGESQPTDPNTTSAGKANNRRVEFIKL